MLTSLLNGNEHDTVPFSYANSVSRAQGWRPHQCEKYLLLSQDFGES